MGIIIEEYKSDYLAKIELLIADDDYLRKDIIECLEEHPEFAIIAKKDNELVGVGTFDSVNRKSAVIVYVKPSMREEGIGSELLRNLERSMKNTGIEEIVCNYKFNESIQQFLYNRGYEHWFDSNYMIFSGTSFIVDDFGITNYKDDDYIACEKIVSEAFHKMRLFVGMESKLDKPSEKQRLWYQKNADNNFVLKEQGRIVAVARLDENEIDAVAVDINEHGKGYGKKMVKYVINILLERGNKSIVLWAVEGNPAKYLYEKLGFKTERFHEFTKKRI